jgi:hypothetical protein
MWADEADVHPVNVIDDEHDHERQDVAFHFRDGGRERRIGALVIPEMEVFTWFSPTVIFMRGGLGAALLIDIIQLIFCPTSGCGD